MGGNVQCPVCTLFLLPGMDLSDHLETHPKEQVIKALVQISLKSEVAEIVIPDNPIKAKKITSSENSTASHSNTEHGSTTPTSEITNDRSLPSWVEKNEKRREPEDNSPQSPVPQNLLLSRQSGYLFDNNSSSCSSSSSNNYFGPPTTYYHPHQHQSQQQQEQQQQQQQQQQHQQQQQQQNQSQQHHHNHLQNYHPLQNHLQSGSNATISQGPPQPPFRLFSYLQQPKPLQPPPEYGAAISQLRSQNSQNQMGSSNVNRPMYSPGNYIPPSSSVPEATSSRLAPPLPPPPPPLNQRYQPNFPQIETGFNDTNDNSELSPKRTLMTSPIRPPPQLYRSPLSSGGQYSRQSNSPYSTMAGSPSVLRFAESPVTAHYLERENGDFIVQETPKHVVECVEKDDGEFSVIERVYHMPPSVVQINEDQDDDMSETQSISYEMKTEEDDRSNGTWSGDRSPEERQISQLRAQKKSAITVLSDVQLDLNEYLDLMGNIIASGKVAKTRSEIIKIEKFEPEEDVKDELGDPSCLTEDVEDNASLEKQQQIDDTKKEQELVSDRSASHCFSSSSPSAIPPATDLSITPGTTSVIRLAANPNGRSNTPTIVKKVDETTLTTGIDISETKDVDASVGKINSDNQINKADESVQSTSSNTKLDETIHMVSVGLTKCEELTSTAKETEAQSPTADTVAKVENAISHINSQSQPQADHTQVDAAGQTSQKQHEVHTKEGKQSVKENPPAYAYFQSVKRPFKKFPKKLIIKPKSKDLVTSQFASQPQTEPTQRSVLTSTSTLTTTTTPTSIPTSTPTPTPTPTPTATSAPTTPTTTIPAPATSPSSIPSTSTSTLLELQKEIRLEIKDNNVKVENVSHSPLEKMPPPLLADSNEKLPPDDEVQPSTSNPMESEGEAALPLEEEKPTTDLSAFLNQCMKKEEVEERPMHSIFGMEIDDRAETLNNVVKRPAPNGFPSASLFSKPLASTEHFSISEIVLPDRNNMQEQDHSHNSHQSPQQQQNNSPYVEYPFSFLYGAEANHQEELKHNISPPMYCSEDFNKYSASTSNGNSASCTWYQSQSSENDFETDGKGSYLDLDSCKRSVSFAAATEGSMPTADGINIRTDEKMPAKGEISEQESNCGVESSWSQPAMYNEFPVLRFPNHYQNFMTTNESWSQDHYFRPQHLSSSTETKNFGLRLSGESPAMDTLPSTSKRKNKMITKMARKKFFQCAHCNTNFPLLKEKNAHLIKQHGYKRVNRRLIRDPPTSTVTTATMNPMDAGASLLLGLEPSTLPPPPLAEEEDSKAAIVKIEQENQEQKDCQKGVSLALTTTAPPTSASISRTKYDSMRARDNRMLINFNLNALNVKNEGEAQSYYMESKSSFCCFVCRRDFLTVKLFDEHLTEHPAECFTCHKKFTRWKNFMVHLKRHLGWKDFGCTFCEKKFVIRSALVEHMRMHTGLTPLKCKICGKSFKRYSNLTQHRKRHGTKINRTKEYVCYCGEVLPSKARFIWHKETHDLKPKCCPYCRDRFVHANSLRRHIRLAHSDKFDYTEPMECPMCKQIYAKSSIKAHMATHSMDTQHECLICNKSFSTKWNLKIHNWVHANRTTKPFKCDHCVKAFVREVDYNNHMNSHKQIKPYTCEYCGCKFIRKYNYIRHRREHHGNKKFTCDICGKLFHRHYYLIEHRRIHTGERPFQCTICGKSSTTKTNHNKHLKIHHSRDPFTSEA